jgi:hypothetical protein
MKCGGRGFGLDLGEILFAMYDPQRSKSDRLDGLSGIEVGFIRAIGDIIDIIDIITVASVPVRTTSADI